METIVQEIKDASYWHPDLEFQLGGVLFRNKNAFKVRLRNLVEIGTRDTRLWKKVARSHGYHVTWFTKHECTALVFEKKSWNPPLYLLPFFALILKQALKFY